MEGRYNYDEESADVIFATNDKLEAVQTARDFGQGMIVVSTNENGDKYRIFTAPYNTELSIKE
jgi:hypothetical protein